MIRTILAAFMFFGAFSTASAQQFEGTWTHNGSLMLVTKNGPNIEISYLSPRQGMRRVGATSDSSLFSGTIYQGNRIQGTAVVFKGGCYPLEYEVAGRYFVNNRGRLVIDMFGLAPVFNGCQFAGLERNFNSRLIFEEAPHN